MIGLLSVRGHKISIGAVYPRFPSQHAYRMAVSAAIAQPRHRSKTLSELLAKLDSFGEAGPAKPNEMPELIRHVATQRFTEMKGDAELPLRLYAQARLMLDRADGQLQEELREQLRQADANESMQWATLIEWIADDVEVVPYKGLSASDFEIAVSALATGLALRAQVAELPSDLYERVVSALVVGFFQTKPKDKKAKWWHIHERLERFFAHDARRQLRREALRHRLEQVASTPADTSTDDVSDERSLSPAVQRALAAEAQRSGVRARPTPGSTRP